VPDEVNIVCSTADQRGAPCWCATFNIIRWVYYARNKRSYVASPWPVRKSPARKSPKRIR